MQPQILQSMGFRSGLDGGHNSGGMKSDDFYAETRLSNVHGGPAHCPYLRTAVCNGAVVAMEIAPISSFSRAINP